MQTKILLFLFPKKRAAGLEANLALEAMDGHL